MRKRRVVLALLAFVAILVGLVGLDLYLVLRPDQIEARVRTALERTFRYPVRMGKIDVSPFRGITIDRVEVLAGADGTETFIDVREVRVPIEWTKLDLGDVRIIEPRVTLHRRADGRWNVEDALRPEILAPTEETPDLPQLVVLVEGGTVVYRDEVLFAEARDTVLEDVAVRVRLDPELGLLLRGTAREPLAKGLAFELEAWPAERAFALRVDAQKVRVGPDLRERLPKPGRAPFDILQAGGIADISIRATNRGRKEVDLEGEIRVHRGTIQTTPFPMLGRDVSGKVLITKEKVLLRDLKGWAGGEARVACTGEIRLVEGGENELDIWIDGEDVPLEGELGLALPGVARRIYQRFAPRGRGRARVHIFGRLTPAEVPDEIHWDVEGFVEGATVAFEEFPLPVEDLSGRFAVHDKRFVIHDLRGRAEGGEVRIQGQASDDRIHIGVSVAGARAAPPLRDHLLPKHRKLYDLFEPSGLVDAEIDVFGVPADMTLEDAGLDSRIGGDAAWAWARAGGLGPGAEPGLVPDFRATLVPRPGFKASYVDAPYPLEIESGAVRLTSSGAQVEALKARRGDARFRFDGRVDGIEDARLAFTISATDVPVDDALERAIGARGRPIFESLGLSGGFLSAQFSVFRPPGAEVRFGGDVGLRGARLRPEVFPVELVDVTADVRSYTDRAMVRSLEATFAGGGRVRAMGSVLYPGATAATGPGTAKPRFDVSLGLEDVAVASEAIRRALPPDVAKTYAFVGLTSGLFSGAVSLRGSGAETVETAIAGRFRDVAFALEAFPYPVRDARGEVRFEGGRVVVEGLEGRLGQGVLGARLEASGIGPGFEGTPAFTASVRATGLPIDKQLREALPEGVRSSFARFDPAGTADVVALVTFDPKAGGGAGGGGAAGAAGAGGGGVLYFIGESVLHGARLDAGVLFRDVDGRVQLAGSWPRGRQPQAEGGIAIDRAVIADQPCVKLHARYQVTPAVLTISAVEGLFCGGVVRGGAFARLEEPRTFGGDFTLDDARVEALATSVYGERARAAGRLDVVLRFRGESENPKRFSGSGRIAVREARLYELPIVAGILNVLSLSPPEKPVFDEAVADLRLEPDRIVVERAEIQSSAVSLYGKGEIRDGEQRLIFVPELGRTGPFSFIPGVDELWRLIKGTLIQVEVTGPVAAPVARVIPLSPITGPFFRGEDRGPRSREIIKEP